ncbi:MAG: DUF58 domain-containing protein [Pseudohongiella nitratireducens]|nr:DUF58 domain-containing protein [Pseudohongiella nitratireducens]
MDSGLSRRSGSIRQHWRHYLTKRQERWLDRRVPPASSLRLGQRSIFILPTIQGALFGFGAAVVLVIAVAERNPFSILLTATLLSLFLLSLVLCYRNLSGLQLAISEESNELPRARCFAGEKAQFSISISPAGLRRSHHDIWIGFNNNELQPQREITGSNSAIHLSVETDRRGVFQAPRMLLRTRYPAGLWQSWSRPHLNMRYLVYPRPAVCAMPERYNDVPESSQGNQLTARQSGVDDLFGLRSYSPGDSRRRIAWQSLARGQGLKTKQFVSEGDAPVMLSMAMFPGRDPEAALSCLSYLVVLLISRGQQKVGLILPGSKEIKPGWGEAHKHKLLQALALWK